MSTDTYRFTGEDEVRIRTAIDGYCAERVGHAVSVLDVATMQRLAAHAIGCGWHDLRDIECDWIDHSIGDAIGDPIPAGMTTTQYVAVVALCERYRAPFVDADWTRNPFDLPAGYVAGTVAGVSAGVSPHGYVCT
jgi:hypothetical protein